MSDGDVGRSRPGGTQHIPRPAAWSLGGAAPWSVPSPRSADAVAALVGATEQTRQSGLPTFPSA
ncbi:MAG TPA: hypothetical protein PLV68_15425, partial [Ilumatobacteraceae bacterium]|nr:hypothetical protein [Ilumatobacteraceae bacterium]